MIRTPSLFGLQRIISRITGAGTLIFGGAITTDQTQTFQNKTGTIALTSDIGSGPQSFKNLLHNGRVQVDQRATLATPITVALATYGPDGWIAEKTVAGQVMTIAKAAVVNTPMVGSIYACKLNITTGAALGVATDRVLIQRKIEGTIFSRCNFGTAQAGTIYYSFWAESTTTGIFSVSLSTPIAGRSYVLNHTITAANTRQLFQGSFPGETSGTWTTDDSASATFTIALAAAATYQTTAGAWQNNQYFGTATTANFASAVNSFQVSDLYLGTEQISGVTTDYPHVPYDVELLRCNRYLQRTKATTSGAIICDGIGSGATNVGAYLPLHVGMRDVPAIVVSNATHFSVNDTSGVTACNSVSIGTRNHLSMVQINFGVAAGLTQYRPYQAAFNTTSGTLDLSAEL